MASAHPTEHAEVAFGIADVLAAIPASMSQVAEWTGVSRRQIAYWISQGILPAEERISAATVLRVALIKAELDRDVPLRRAAAKAAAALETAASRLDLEAAAPISDVAELIDQRIEECLTTLAAAQRGLSALSNEEIQALDRQLRQLTRSIDCSDNRLPSGFLLWTERLIEALSPAADAASFAPEVQPAAVSSRSSVAYVG